jgi:hypothetical protein
MPGRTCGRYSGKYRKGFFYADIIVAVFTATNITKNNVNNVFATLTLYSEKSFGSG